MNDSPFSFQKHVFEVKEVRSRQSSNFFIQGRQVKVDEVKRKTEKVGGQIPATNIDYVKHFLVTWCPSLNFGWLKPKYEEIKVTFDYVESVTCLNVIPTQKPSNSGLVELIEYDEGFSFSMLSEPPSETDWLLGEPPSPEQLKRTLDLLREKRCSERFCWSMALSHPQRDS
jgi:hypothetical protein